MRSKRRLFCLLDFVLPVGNLIFPIANLMVDGACIATTGGSYYGITYVGKSGLIILFIGKALNEMIC
jgi:hypothetical protein